MDGGVGALENVETFSGLLDGFRAEFPENTLVLSSGDNYVPGPRFYAAADRSNVPIVGIAGNGRGDIAFLNAMGFQASALGNHELDHGTGVFASIITAESQDGSTYHGAAFPYLSSNLDFTNDKYLRPLVAVDAQQVDLMAGGLAKSTTITVSGEAIGIVGATTPFLGRITGVGDIEVQPEESSDIDKLSEIIQRSVDDLIDLGVNKIVLLAHMQQIAVEKALATRLKGVDVIVAGGSNTILADETDRLRQGDVAEGTYPLKFASATGEPVLLVNSDADYRYLGRLVVDFDSQGVLLPESVDPAVSGAYATDSPERQPIPEVTRIVESLRNVLQARDGNILGKTGVYLAGRRHDIRTQETNLGNLVADSFLWLARQVDREVSVSLKNSGGIRDHIGVVLQPPGATDTNDVKFLPTQANPDIGKREGDISQFDVEGVLRFNNGLVIVPLTVRQLVEIMEYAVGFDGVGEATAGRFPQIGGMRFSFDPSLPIGHRVRSLAVVDDDGKVTDRVVENGVLVGDTERVIKMATLNFTANGGDGYPFPLPAHGRIDLIGEAGQINAPTPDFPDSNGNGAIDAPVLTDPGLATFARAGTEQDALAEYLAHFYAKSAINIAETPPLDDARIQNLGIPGRRDTVYADMLRQQVGESPSTD